MVCEIFRTLLDDYSCLFSATLPTMFGKPWMNISTNSNLRSIVQVYHFFLGSINVQRMFSLVYTVYYQKPAREVEVFCKKRYSEKFCKFHRKTPVLESLFNKVAGLTRILKNICQQLLLHCTHTTHCYLSVLLYIQHLLTHHHCYYC